MKFQIFRFALIAVSALLNLTRYWDKTFLIPAHLF